MTDADGQRVLDAALLAHELRTPLTVVQGYAEMIAAQAHGDLSPAYVEDARVILAACRHMAALTEGMMTLGAMAAGTLVLHETGCDLRALVEEACAWLSPAAARAGLSLVADLAAVRGPVRGDVRLLRQALLNLLDNAIRYAPRNAGVEISARPVPQGGLCLAVANPGDAEAPFELFARGKTEPETSGLGLGLMVARGVMRAHGGDCRWIRDRGRVAAVLDFPAFRLDGEGG